MYLEMKGILDAKTLAFARQVVESATWADGADTAGGAARFLKRNQELDWQKTANAENLQQLVVRALANHQDLSEYALPLRFSRPIISRYAPGMHYGSHVDNPLLQSGNGTLRTDVSMTVFLAEPDSYDGGELVLEIDGMERKVKLAAGDAVAYTTGTRHRVAEVTRGARIVAVCWLQSAVPDPGRREILSKLHRVHHALTLKAAEEPETALFMEAYFDLVRLWTRT